MIETYSQIKQDLEVIKFYDNLRGGYFVDIGAYDGIEFSNTYLLEKNFDWKGICVEPLPSAFNQLKNNRKATTICLNTAAFSESNMELIFSCSSMLSGAVDYLSLELHPLAACGEKINVTTTKLSDILESWKSPKFIHYLSLDTEGTELEILTGVNLKEYVFGLINLEHNWVEDKRQKIRELLLRNGYLYRGEVAFDDNYIHRSLIEGHYVCKDDHSDDIDILVDVHSHLVTITGVTNLSGKYDSRHNTIKISDGAVGTLTFNQLRMNSGKIYMKI